MNRPASHRPYAVNEVRLVRWNVLAARSRSHLDGLVTSRVWLRLMCSIYAFRLRNLDKDAGRAARGVVAVVVRAPHASSIRASRF